MFDQLLSDQIDHNVLFEVDKLEKLINNDVLRDNVQSFVGTLYKYAALDVPVHEINERRIGELIADFDKDYSFRRAQAHLLEVVVNFERLSDKEYLSMDLFIHMSFCGAVLDYVRTWIEFLRRQELGYWSERDLECVKCALNDVLAIASIGYPAGFCKTGSLTDVISSVRRGPAVLARSTSNVALGLRTILSTHLRYSVTNVFFYAYIGFEVWERYGAVYDRGSALTQIALYGETTMEPSLAQQLVLGYAEMEWYGAIPTVTVRRASALEFYVRAKNTVYALLAYFTHLLIVHSPESARGVLATGVGAFLSLSVWQMALILVGIRTIRLFQAVGAATQKQEALERQRAALLQNNQRIMRAVEFVEQTRRF